MATTPAYAATPHNGSALIGIAETDLQIPTHAISVFVAGPNGSKIEEITVQASVSGGLVATTVAGLVYLFLYDGSTYHLFDNLTIGAVTASTTTGPYRISKIYNNLIIKTGWTLYASQSIAGNASLLKIHAFGGDY